MKRAMALMLAAALCLLAVSATAEDRVLLENDNTYYQTVTSACAVGDTVYMLVMEDSGLSLYGWNEGMDEAVRFDDVNELVEGDYLLSAALDGTLAERMQEYVDAGKDPVHAVTHLFTDGERLMSLNPATGLVFAIDVKDGAATYTDIVTLGDNKPFLHVEEDWCYMNAPSGATVAGGKLLWAVNDWDHYGNSIDRMVVADLETGEVTTSGVKFIGRVCGYDGEKALVSIRDEQNAYQEDGTVVAPVLAIYDPGTDSVQTVGEFDMRNGVGNMIYSPRLDAVLYADRSRIQGISLADGATRQVGFYAGDYPSQAGTQVLGDSFVMATYDRVVVRTVSADFSADHFLTVYGSWNDEGRRLFTQRYPDVPVYDNSEYYSDLESINRAMISGSGALDVLRMDVAYSPFYTMRDKGYCADLSGYPELVAAVERMYPCYQEIVKKDGKLIGVPVGAYSFGWYVSNEVMDMLDLTIDDIPTNFEGLCAFITAYNDTRAEDEEANVVLLDCGDNVRQFLFSEALEMYMDWCNAEGKDITFNTPEFRAVMTAVENVRTEKLKVQNWEDDVYYMPLLNNGNQVVGQCGGYMNEYYTFLPMTLTADTTFFTSTDVEVLFVNPRSENIDTAVDFIRCKLEALEDRSAFVLFTDKTEPVENAYYPQYRKSIEEYIQQLQATLEDTEDETTRQELQETLDGMDRELEMMERYSRYAVSEEDIRFYREDLLPYVTVAKPKFTTGTRDDAASELNTLVSRYMDGQIGLDQFIREADNKMFMIRMENN